MRFWMRCFIRTAHELSHTDLQAFLVLAPLCKAGLSAIFQRNHRCDQCAFACAVSSAQLTNCHTLIYKHFLFFLHFARLDFQLFFNVITVVINALFHALFHPHSSRIATHWSSSISCFSPLYNHCGRNRSPTRTLFAMDTCTSVHELSDSLLRDLTSLHCGPQISHNWRWMSTGSVLGTKKTNHCTQFAPGGWSEGALLRERLPSQNWASQRFGFVGISRGKPSYTPM